MPNLRYATPDDAPLITAHRHSMFQDNKFAGESRFVEMDATFEPWVRERLADGRYIGLLLEEDGHIIAGSGIFLQDFPPHWMDIQPTRAYLLNFYTTPEARGRGFARQMLTLCVEECRKRGIGVVTLHASPFGRPIYEKFGFSQSTEMMLRLQSSQEEG
jgi:GNAT superfamily N-acetyltransferase